MPCCNTATYNRLQRVLRRPYSCTTHAAKQRTGLHRRFSCDLSNSTAVYTRPAKADIMPPAPRWSVSQRRSTSSAYQIQASRRTLYRSAQTAYYNNVYKGAPPVMDPCQTAQYIADHASPAGSAPTVCGSLASDTPGAPAEGSASPSAQGQPGGL